MEKPKKWTLDISKLPSDLVTRIVLQVREADAKAQAKKDTAS